MTFPALRDPALDAWMRQAHRYPLLNRAEELALAKAFRAGDAAAGQRLAAANLRLVFKLALEHRQGREDLADLIQEGNVGLMHAVRRFDPGRGLRFCTYAAYWIRAYLLRYLLGNARLVRLGTTQGQRKVFYNLRREEEALRRSGVADDAPALAARLATTEAEVTETRQRLAGADVSLDVAVLEDGPTRLELLAADEDARPDRQAEHDELRTMIHTAVERAARTFNARDRVILAERLLADDPASLSELGQRFGVSRERVRQLEQRLLVRVGAELGGVSGVGGDVGGGLAHAA